MPYNSPSSRRARSKVKRRNRQLFMSGSFLSVLIVMVITFMFGSATPLFNWGITDIPENTAEDSESISDSSVSSEVSVPEGTVPLKTSNKTFNIAAEKYTICVDPGHGFADPGAISTIYNDLHESEVNLDVALKLTDLLKSRGFNVIMTHDTNNAPEGHPANYKVTLDDRCTLANTKNVDLFISLHCNSYQENPNVSGIRLYYFINNTGTTDEYASFVSQEIETIMEEECAIHPHTASEAYQVCRDVKMPSLLLEMGFITNQSDSDELKDENWKQNIALGIADGISAYCEAYPK